MTKTIQASTILINDLETKLNLKESKDITFFSEWQHNLPEIDSWEKQALDRLKTGYLDVLKNPPILENYVRISIL